MLPIVGPVVADVFVLKGGGRLEGEWLNRQRTTPKQYVVRTQLGGKIVLRSDQVDRVMPQGTRRQQYEQIVAQHPDTVEGHWAVAEWCRRHFLAKERREHLRRVLELDPEHQDARRALGYRKVDGRWMTQDDLMTKRGFVRYKGRWLLPQEVKILEQRRKEELAQKEWIAKLKNLREALNSDEAARAAEQIQRIDDAYAHRAIREQLEKEPNPNVRRLYLESLVNIGTPPAMQTLVDVSLRDPDEETRMTAIDWLKRIDEPEIVSRYVEALHDKSNVVVNRAAYALAELEDPRAIGPLIDALVTTHKYQVTEGQPGMINSTFSRNGGGGFSGGGGGGISVGGGPKIVTRRQRNRDVLDALVRLTRENFEYDAKRWKNWFALQKRAKTVDTRRD